MQAFTCLELTMETAEQHQSSLNEVVLVFLLLTLNEFHILFCSFYCLLYTNKCRLGCQLIKLEECIAPDLLDIS